MAHPDQSSPRFARNKIKTIVRDFRSELNALQADPELDNSFYNLSQKEEWKDYLELFRIIGKIRTW